MFGVTNLASSRLGGCAARFGATMSDSNVENLLRNVFLSAAYIVTSGAMILYNAKILKEVHPYPALLTTGHMVFSGGLSVALVVVSRAGIFEVTWLPMQMLLGTTF